MLVGDVVLRHLGRDGRGAVGGDEADRAGDDVRVDLRGLLL